MLTVDYVCPRDYRNFNFADANAIGPARIAKIAAECGVSNFIQVSHLNAAKASPSQFYHNKAVGEELIKEAFPTATIVRPSTMYGYEDKLLTNMAGAFCGVCPLHNENLTCRHIVQFGPSGGS